MTKEEKKRKDHNEYVKWWNQHSESYKKYQKEYHREYSQRNKGFYVYFFIDTNGEIVYVGKTINLKSRMAYHKCTKEYWEEGYTILYIEFKDINDDILIDIESMLVDTFRPVKNSQCVDYDCSVDKYLKGFKLKEYKM